MSGTASGSSSSHKLATRKLTRSEKKRLKLEKQHEDVQASLKTKNVETVVFSNPDAISSRLNKHVNANQTDANIESTAPGIGIEIDMRQTRFEIMKFGMNSLKAKDLEDAETTLAVSLGALPNKRSAVNYKNLQAERKKQKELEKEEAETSFKPDLRAGMKKKPQGKVTGKNFKKDKDKGKVQNGGRAAGRSSKNPRSRK